MVTGRSRTAQSANPAAGGRGDVVFVARQPIFRRDREVFGYELLFRRSAEEALGGIGGSAASAALMADTILTSGLATLTGARPAFINFTRELLIGEFYHVLPRERVVIELLEDIPADPKVLAACERLKSRGYRLALDDIGAGTERDTLLAPFADIIKVDLRATTPAERAALRGRLQTRDCEYLAEKVETTEEFDECAALGYDYFQGFFLDRPTLFRRTGMRAFAPTVVRLMVAASRPPELFDFNEIDDLIRTDLTLCYKTLRFANAASNGLRTRITSIREALVLLGREQIQKAAALVMIGGVLDGQPSEIAVSSLVRAKLLEALAGTGNVQASTLDLFLLGMFSRLDAILGESLEDVLALISVSEEVRAALAGEPGPLQVAVALAVAQEHGDWAGVLAAATELEIEPDSLARHYMDAVAFADSALQA